MWLNQLAIEAWKILEESAAFILLGFLIAGVLHVIMARTRWADWLRGLRARTVFLASAVGLPLPLCSCSVLPAAVSLRRQGASKGATISFLISTPETSVQSVLLTYALIGPIMAIYRPVAALVTALTAGLVDNFAEKRWPAEPEPAAQQENASCCHHDEHADHDHGHSPEPMKIGWRDGMRHAFVDIYDDVVGWMLLGVAVAAVIQVLVPGFVLDAVFGPPIQAMLVMLVIGVPLYVCAEASTPIAAALILQGVNPGAALVFLLAGPATNIGSIGLLTRQLGKRTVAIYLTCIAIVSVAMGVLLNWFFDTRAIDISARALSEPLLPPWLKTIGAVVFVLLALGSVKRLDLFGKLVRGLDRWLPVHVTSARFVTAIVLIAMAIYMSAGFVRIEPGQMGIIKRFGAMVGDPAGPGLHYHWPYPFGSVDRVDTQSVRRLVLGARSGEEDFDPDESSMLLGDENIANIKSVIKWHMAPEKVISFAYAAADRQALVRDAARASMREVLASAEIDTVFTTAQHDLAMRIGRRIQDRLDDYDCGIRLISFDFLDLHAPAEVHDAFRDVASALEDKLTQRNRALARKAKIIPLAKGTRQRNILDARSYEHRIVGQATGEASRFTHRYEAYCDYPQETRTRVMFDMYDRVLPGLRKCIRPSTGNLELDLRFNMQAAIERTQF